MYLVDTNVLSAGSPTKAAPVPDLASWMERNSEHLYLSVITVAEVEDGIAKARREGAPRKADRLAEWLEVLLHLYSARVLPLDVSMARLLGRMSDQARGAGQTPGMADLAIAATAACRGYTVLTRNLRHFRGLAVAAHDPFESLPTKGK
ncbi:MAG: PIN domain-containing protein [Terriglobales bacterium]